MRGVSLTHPMLGFFCFVFFNLGSFSYTSHAFFSFLFFLSLFLSFFLSFPSKCGKLLLDSPCWLYFFIWGVSLTHPVVASFLYGEFPLHNLSWFHFYAGSFSYTSRAGFFSFIWGVSLTHPVLASFFHLGSLSYTSHAGFIFMCGVSLTHPALASFWGVSLTHPMLASFFFFFFFFFFFKLGSFSYTSRAGFLLHIWFWLYLSVGSFSYISWTGFIFMRRFLMRRCWLFFIYIFEIRGVSLTHPVLALFLIWGVSLTHPCAFFSSFFSVGSLSDTSHAFLFSFLFLLNVGSLS